MQLGQRGMFAGFIAAIALLVLLDVGLATHRDANWWAAWGSWIGGVGSFAAAAAALWIAYRGWNRSDSEAREHEAAKFAMWVFSDGSETPVVAFVNTTALPVYDVVVRTRILNFNMTFHLGTCSPTSRTGQLTQLGGAMKNQVRIAVRSRMGQHNLATTNEEELQELIREEKATTLEVIREIKLSVTFRQRQHLWRAEHDGTLTQL
ncbi:hypothetical protein ACFXPA_38760 [Amycolatopsis sp. NPDC059090]|uniref:hypothetical protein n=1 Tax=unclassified Amycolatopsis TaxID=2618356 RepID=UPI00366BC8BA